MAAAGLLLAATPAAAQDAPARRLNLTSSASLGQTLTDSYLPETSDIRRSEAITTLGAGIVLRSRGARLQGDLNYSLTGIVHARDSRANGVQNRLQATLQSELVDRHFFLNAQASIAQLPVSAFALQTADDITNSRNRSEVTTVRVQPALRGTVAGKVDMEAAFSLAGTDSGEAENTTDSANASATLSLASAGGGRFGWSLAASRQVVDFKQGRQTENDRYIATISLRPDVDWQLRLRGGVEYDDFRRADGKDRYDNWGAGVTWTPSPRTTVSLDGDRRSFGHAHSVSVQHRARRTVLSYTSSQSISDGTGDTAQGLVGAFALFFDLFASQEPDPALREQLVNSFLARNNLQADSQITTGFLTSAVSLQKRQEFSVALQGLRTTWVASVFGSESSRVDTLSGAIDDTANGGRVRQRGLSFTVSHRVTPTASLSLLASVVRGGDLDRQRTDLRSVSAVWTDRLGRRTTYSLGVRHSEFDADLDPYSENALTANVSMSF